MSYLNKLLEGAEVEWKTLGEVLTIKNGKDYKNFQIGNFPVYGSGGIMTFIDTYVYDKPSVLIPRKGSLGNLYYVDVPFWTVDTIFWTDINVSLVEPKFVYYFLQTQHLEELNMAGGVPSLTQKVLNKVPIPIPPLHVQKEIVRILDTFTELTEKLTAELTAELTARKKQYEYYRDKLLSFSDITRGGVKSLTMNELGELVRGNGLPKSDFTDTGVPAIHYGQIYTYYGVYTSKTISFVSEETAKKLRKVNYGDIVITNTSENIEDVGKAVVYLGEEQAVTGGHATIFKPSKAIIGKFFAYFTQTADFSSQKRKYAKGTKVIDVSAKDMAKILIPVPPLEEQARIVSILDKFDTLTNSISEGLPKEIELRKKQYEYYRDRLLTFV